MRDTTRRKTKPRNTTRKKFGAQMFTRSPRKRSMKVGRKTT